MLDIIYFAVLKCSGGRSAGTFFLQSEAYIFHLRKKGFMIQLYQYYEEGEKDVIVYRISPMQYLSESKKMADSK